MLCSGISPKTLPSLHQPLTFFIKRMRGCYRVVPLDEPVVQALRRIARDQVADMPDRIIGATALYLGLPLITRDSNLTSSELLTCMW